MNHRQPGRIVIWRGPSHWHAICGHCPTFPAVCISRRDSYQFACPKEWAHVAALANEHYKEKHRG